MATQAPEATSTTAQRTALAAVTARMLAELRHLWPSLPMTKELQPLLRYEVLPAVVNQYGDAAATLAADWYDAERARLNVPGRFGADVAPQPPEDLLRASSNYIAEPIKLEEPDVAIVQARAEGVTQKLVADMSRQTVAQSAERDPNARGWARFTDGDACAFCLMLAGRGGVYTKASVRFGSHDHCHCLAGPVWDANYKEWVGEYQRATHRSNSQREAANRLAREWLRENRTPGDRKAGQMKPQAPADLGLQNMSDQRLEHLIGVTEALPDTPYKRQQLARLRAEKKRRG